MKTRLRLDDFWNPRGTTPRGAYMMAGVGLMALKFGLDRLLVRSLGGDYWKWLSYWKPLGPYRTNADFPRYLIPLLVPALPFSATGVGLTLGRLRDGGWPRWRWA